MTFIWQEPLQELKNGIITSYVGFITELPRQNYSVNVTTNNTEVVIVGLNPHTTYEFQVAAENSIGLGPFSAIYLTKTEEDGMYMQHKMLGIFISVFLFLPISTQ